MKVRVRIGTGMLVASSALSMGCSDGARVTVSAPALVSDAAAPTYPAMVSADIAGVPPMLSPRSASPPPSPWRENADTIIDRTWEIVSAERRASICAAYVSDPSAAKQGFIIGILRGELHDRANELWDAMERVLRHACDR